MLQATRIPAVTFTPSVGVAPATTTMTLAGAQSGLGAIPSYTRGGQGFRRIARPNEPACCTDCACLCSGCPQPARIATTQRAALGRAPRPLLRPRQHSYYNPYQQIEALKGGLGVVNESDAWLTGRPYGLPGTAAVRFMANGRGGYTSNMLGDAGNDGSDTASALWLIAGSQHAAQKSLKKIAFWTALMGGVALGTVTAAIIAGVASKESY